jgi:hypothetical protein
MGSDLACLEYSATLWSNDSTLTEDAYYTIHASARGHYSPNSGIAHANSATADERR